MAIKKCAYCGSIFNSFGADICAQCGVTVDEAYDKVKKYIYQNPKETDFAAIVKNTDVSEKAINYLIENGRLEVRKPGSGLKCRVCGADITEGSMCVNCMRRMLTGKPSEQSEKKQDGNKSDKNATNPLVSRQR